MEKWISAYESLTSLERGKIGPRLQSRPNRKCHTRFCLVPKSTTLKDLEGSLCFKTCTTIDPLQQAQNAVARLLVLSRRDHVRPALKELHRLPVVYRIQFKLALVMFTIHTRRCADYLTNSVQVCNSDPARTRLRSASSSDYTVLRMRTKFGDRAFSVAGLVVWNSLPAAVLEAVSIGLSASSKRICLLYVLMTDLLFLQTFVIHSRSGAE